MHWILSQNVNRKKSPNGVRQIRLRILLTTFFVHFGATFSSEDNKLLRRWTITDFGHYLFDDSWSSTNAVCRSISLHDSRWENLNLCPSVRPSSHSCIRQRLLVYIKQKLSTSDFANHSDAVEKILLLMFDRLASNCYDY